jgi:hypothetical protein
MHRQPLATLRILIGLLALGSTGAAPVEPGVLTADEWREDIRELVRTIKETHPDPFHRTSEADFNTVTERLLAGLGKLDDKRTVVEMARIVALVADGHTRLEIPRQHPSLRFSFSHSDPADPAFDELRFASLPLCFRVFGDSMYVVQATSAHRSLLGAEVLALGATPMDEVRRRLSTVNYNDNEMTDMLWAADRATLPELLAALGIIGSQERVTLRVKRLGAPEAETVTLEPLGLLGPDAAPLEQPADRPVPLWLTDTRTAKWSRNLGAERAWFIKLNRMERDTEASLTDYIRDELAAAATAGAERVVIDLRHNHGGSAEVRGVVNSIASSAYNRRGALFVLIGRETFSAAQMLLDELEQYTDALFFGEPSGSHPDHYGDPKRIALSHSGLALRVSRLHWSSWRAFDGRSATRPHRSVAFTIEDFMAGRDPVLQAALEYQAPASLAELVGEVFADGANWDGGSILIKRWMSDPRIEGRDVVGLSRQLIDVAGVHESKDSLLSSLLLYDRARRLSPEQLDAYLGWARTALALGEPGEARSAYRAALRAFEGDREIHAEIEAKLAELPQEE